MQLVEIQSPDGPVLIQVSSGSEAVVAVNALGDAIVKLETTLTEKIRSMLHIAESFRQELRVLEGLRSAEIEFGFGLTAKGSIYVVQTEAQATFKVKLTYGPSLPT